MRKLTLNAENEVIESARRIAKENGTSISSLFTRFIQALDRTTDSKVKTGRLTRQASGMLQVPNEFNERDILGDSLAEKYGIKP